MSLGKVLIVDDELAIRDMLQMALEIADFDCIEAENITDAYRQVIDQKPDMVLLDWMLPGGSGIELLRRLKREELTQDIPVIMLTAKAAEDNVIQGLELGANDYMTKPFKPRELIARIKAHIRRQKSGEQSTVMEVQGLALDQEGRRVFINQQPIDIGPTEFNLLLFFMTHTERAYSRSQLLDHVWGANVYVEERTVDVHIRRLRKALQAASGDVSHLIQTVRGTGYRFSERGVS